MIVIPAIDLLDGRAVRLIKGRKDNITVYRENPLELVREFNGLGVKRIHVVDLDAAFTGGKKNNRELIKKIAELAKSEIEVGGGIRSFSDAERVLDYPVDKIVIGTMPIVNLAEFERVMATFGDRVILGVDVEAGLVRISGWQENSELNHIEFLLKMKEYGVRETIVTDISRDGTLAGVDVEFYKDIATKTGLDVIVSGGIRDIDDIRAVKSLEPFGVKGAIVGKAFYEGTLDLKEALEVQND